MRHPPGQRTDGFHFLGALQLGLQILFFDIGQLEFGDIVADT